METFRADIYSGVSFSCMENFVSCILQRECQAGPDGVRLCME